MLCVIGLMTFSGCEDTGDLWLTKADVVATLSENGALIVAETWNVKTTDSEGYRNLYRTLDLRDSKFNQSSKFTLISVYNESAKKEFPINSNITSMSDDDYEKNVTRYKGYSYVVQNSSYVYEIGAILPSAISSGDTVSITFTYLIEDFAGSYADVAEFDWKPYSTDFKMYISDLSVKVTMPSSVDYSDIDNTYAWLHCSAESNVSLNGNVITVTAKKVPAGTDVGIHSLVPTSSFNELKKTSSESKKTALIAQEDQWQREYEKEQRLLAILGIVDIIASIAFVLIAIALAVLSHVFGRYRQTDRTYLREIPSNWTAAEMGEFFYWYRGGMRKHSGAVLSATMLDLARRDYLDILPDTKEKYRIEVKAVPEAKKEDLRNFEKELMILLSEVQQKNGNKPFTMKQFETFAKGNITFVNKHINKFIQYACATFKKGKYEGEKKFLQKVGPVIGVLMIAVGMISFFFLSKYFFYLLFGGWIGGIILLLGSYKITPLKKDGDAIHDKTLSLRNYMLDFSNLKEYDVPQLILWEEYLVYATMMGISKKVTKKLKLVYKELQQPTNYDATYYRRGYIYTYFYLASRPRTMVGSARMFDLGKSMQTAVRNANAFTRAQQISNSARNGGFGGFGGGGHGGGGFSGGGGFGGGGGGGRH